MLFLIFNHRKFPEIYFQNSNSLKKEVKKNSKEEKNSKKEVKRTMSNYESDVSLLCSMFENWKKENLENILKENNYNLQKTCEIILQINQNNTQNNSSQNNNEEENNSRENLEHHSTENHSENQQQNQQQVYIQNESIPFYGRVNILTSNNEIVIQFLNEICIFIGDITHISERDHQWRQVRDRFESMRMKIISNNFYIEEYKLNILRNSILPALGNMSRKSLSLIKYGHFQQAFSILCDPRSASQLNRQEIDHPSNTLLDLENLLGTMKRGREWWNNDLLILLDQSIALEWRPLLSDTR